MGSTATQPKPQVIDGTLPGFDTIHRYWDKHRETVTAKILPGEYYVTTQSEMITTVLGSCVAACVRDKVFNVGGMNHFMLPDKTSGGTWERTQVNAATRYGGYAMEHLINDVLKYGGRRENLEIKIFGGGKVLTGMSDIGLRNATFVREYLATEKLLMVGEDLGGIYPRKVVFYPETGRAQVKRLLSMHNNTIVSRERKYQYEIEHQEVRGEVDLF